MGIAEVILLI